jgi:uncharacterized membrane protein YdjX (TVP38/TMEM64 family)
MNNDSQSSVLLFVIGVVLGSMIGLVIGSLLTRWLGQDAIRTIQRGLRRVNDNGDSPRSDLFMQ